jgi:hypothetical protein
MAYVVTESCLANPGCLALCDIFAAMDTNDHDIVGVPPFDLPQLRKNVNTVDSAVRPEIQEDYSAAKFSELDAFPAGMDPVEARRKFRGTNAW